MNLRILGAVLVVAGCGGFGFAVAAGYRREERAMQMLIRAIDYMICELRYRMTALPELCILSSQQCTGPVRTALAQVSALLSRQACPDAAGCMEAALASSVKLPEAAKRNLRLLGASLGRFDAQGQLQGLESVKELAQRDLAGLRSGLEGKLRSCRTLGLCAGAALAILLI